MYFTVVNPETGDVVSDIKQDTKQDGGEPMTKTKVEIPSANIDQTFVESEPTIDEDKAEVNMTNINITNVLYWIY